MNFLTGILDLLFPVVCLNCGNTLVINERILCVFCEVKLPIANFHNNPSNSMLKSMWGRVNIDFATAYLYYRKAGITQVLLHHLKYKGRKDIGIYLGERFGHQLSGNSFMAEVDYLIPIPLHLSKKAARGYNQSELICQGMSEVLAIPICQNLMRISDTETQTKKRRFERWLNVSQKFTFANPEILEGKRVLLVDDVFTTGATMEACCLALSAIKHISIGIATLALAKD